MGIVGSLPTADGTSATATPGELFVLDASGHVREVIRGHGIDGPWDATALDLGSVADLFVSNVLNGITNGRRHDHQRQRRPADAEPDRIGAPRHRQHGDRQRDIRPHRPGGPDCRPDRCRPERQRHPLHRRHRQLRIAKVPDAIFRSHPVNAGASSATVSTDPHLNGPLGLTLTPNGDLLAVNGGDNNLVELTQGGKFVTVRDVDTADPPGGALFGLATTAHPRQVYFVNDDTNTLNVLR